MQSMKRSKKGTIPAEVWSTTDLHRELQAVFPTAAIGVDKSYWRDFAFSTATRQSDPALFRECYLRSEVLKRYQHGSTTAKERADAALSGLLDDEAYNKLVTPRIVDICDRASTPDHIARAVKRARRLIKDMLGPFTWEKMYLLCGYSSGASTEHTRDTAHVPLKWESSTQITAGALLPYLGWLAYVGETGEFCSSYPFELVAGNRVFTVVKNFATDRVCAKEPPLNMFLQKGYGSLVRRALWKQGLLHRDAKEHHMALAQEGSALRKLATLDAKSASNSVTLALLHELLPHDHVSAILAMRSPRGELPSGEWTTWEMVSSMGNGFTFEIETLIFYALARAVCGMDAVVSVFGDDIVVPADKAGGVIELLEYCGFRINQDKSFVHGPFRESCGGHYFDGHDVTPFYIEELPNSMAEAVDLHNRMLEWGARGGDMSPLWPIINIIRRQVPRSFRGPYGEQGTLWSDWDQATPTFHRVSNPRHASYNCWRVKAFVKKVPKQAHDYLQGGLRSSLWSGIAATEVSRRRAMSQRDLARGLHPRIYALMFRATEMREAEAASIAFARSSTWGMSTRFLRVNRQWSAVPVRGWREHSVR